VSPDLLALPEPHRRFAAEAAAFLPAGAVVADPVRTLAWGTDASFYRLVPKLVVRVREEGEVRRLLALAARLEVPVTFRAAGTSLSGQAVTDSVLLALSGGWRRATVHGRGEEVTLEPGVIGADANALLLPHGRRIGPDPASLGACMIGGIVANNASGMCCGTAHNSYRTLSRMRLLLADGAVLDSGDPASRREFQEGHRSLLEGLAAIRREILADAELSGRIRRKYRIKNTTGYRLDAFLDFEDPLEILVHLLVGSEGTLGFVSEVTLRTVEEHAHRASALVLFPDVVQAARAVQALAALPGRPVSAAELMDRASLRAVEAKPGMPAGLAGLPAEAAALLLEVRAPDPGGLEERMAAATGCLSGVPTLARAAFTAVRAEYEALWDVRRGLFPAVGAARPVGTTVVIEDVAFPTDRLAEGAAGLQALLREHGYAEGILFGHALDGNLHFVFTPSFGAPAEVERYRRFLDAVCDLVVGRFDGSLKGEHGTGRNMAPYVEREWGARAHGLMRRVKVLLDPGGILNPGVVLNDDPLAHVRHLKPLPAAHELVDRCTECGFCEPRCPSRALSLTPRQRIVVRRELARLQAEGGAERGAAARRERFLEGWRWLGDETCATDGLCATACPVGIDTGKLVKELRAEARSPAAQRIASAVAGRYGGAVGALRAALLAARAARALLGARGLAALSRGLRAASGGRLPQWNAAMPGPSPGARFPERIAGRGGPALVYLPSCVVRAMGAAPGDPDARAEHEAVLSVLDKAGCEVRFPRDLASLCCGLTFESKGFPEEAARKAAELSAALLEASEGGRLPVLCDTSPCAYRMRQALDGRLTSYEPAELIHSLLMDRLRFERREGTVAIHVTCSSTKMNVGERLRALAEACAERVVAPPVGCCGFAGDRGFSHPELNASALRDLRGSLPPECRTGYSNSRTCQIGLTLHAGIPYQSIVHLVDRCTSARG